MSPVFIPIANENSQLTRNTSRDWYNPLYPFQGERSSATQAFLRGNLSYLSQVSPEKEPAWRLNAPRRDDNIIYQSRQEHTRQSGILIRDWYIY